MSDYLISTDPKLLNMDFIVRSLQSTYWAHDRPRDIVVTSFSASVCFGVYERHSGAQVGFARVVTDSVTFSWLCDVFVAPTHRSMGLGKQLVTAVIEHPQIAGTKIYLGTRDAHGLYERFDFRRWEVMRRIPSMSARPAPGLPPPQT